MRGKSGRGLRLVRRGGTWHITGTLFGRRVRKSTGATERAHAEVELTRVREQETRRFLLGDQAVPDFNTLAAKYLAEAAHKSIHEDARYIEQLMHYIGDIPFNRIWRGYNEKNQPTPLERYVLARAQAGKPLRRELKPGEKPPPHKPLSRRTVNYAIGVINTIGAKAMRVWKRADGSPLMQAWTPVPIVGEAEAERYGFAMPRKRDPLSWKEQNVWFGMMPDYIHQACLFDVNTGLRSANVVGLRWQWEHRVEGFPDPVFVVPGRETKNGVDHVVVLNEIALQVIRRQRGEHPEFVFPNRTATGPIRDLHGTAFRTSRKHAVALEPGVAKAGVHTLRHTFAHRLRAAGVTKEDRDFLLGHEGRSMAEHYAAPELFHLRDCVNRIIRPVELALVKDARAVD